MEIAEILFKAGTDVTLRNSQGHRAIDLAKDPKMGRLLYDFDIINNQGRTSILALHRCLVPDLKLEDGWVEDAPEDWGFDIEGGSDEEESDSLDAE